MSNDLRQQRNIDKGIKIFDWDTYNMMPNLHCMSHLISVRVTTAQFGLDVILLRGKPG